jgi:streptomycin 6-kinase
VEEAIEIAGHLARRLAVPAPPATVALAATAGPWLEELDRHRGFRRLHRHCRPTP